MLTVRFEGVDYLRLRWGFEGVLAEPVTWRCHDCRVLPGAVHHAGCCVEYCPHCHDQAISCEAFDMLGAPEGDES